MTKNLKPIDMCGVKMKRLFSMCLWTLCMWGICASTIEAQSYSKMMRKGADAYDQGDLVAADSNFTKANAANKNAESFYNLGNTRFKGQKYDDALDSYNKALDNVKVDSIKSDIQYNIGNSLMELKRYDEAIDAYKTALKTDPGAQDIVHNLMLARQRKKQQEQEQKQDPNQQSENSDEASQDQKQDESSASDQNESNKSNTDSEELPQSTAQMLQAIENEESKVQQKLRNQHVRPNRSNKNW